MSYDELTRQELIQRLEALEARRDDASEAHRVLHELQVYQLELEAQNQALREAQGQVEESRSRYADLYDFAPIAYCTFDPNGVVLEINLTGASILGKERAFIIGKPFAALVRLEDPNAFSKHIKSSCESSIPVVSELVLSIDRRPLEVQLISAAVRGARGSPNACRTAFLDITRRRAAEREARAAHGLESALRARLEGIDRASAAVSSALARLSGPDLGGFLQVIVDQAREILNVEYAALGIGGANGQKFDPFVFSGVSAEQAAAIGRKPRGIGVLGAAIHAGRAIRLRELREHGAFSGFPPHHPAMASFLGVPIPYHGESRGTLYLANKVGRAEFSEDDQTLAEMLADRVGAALEIARLRQIEAREHVRLKFLARAGSLLAETIDYEATLDAIARLVVPAAADLSAINLLQEDGSLRKVVAYHPDPAKQALLDRLVGTTPPERLPDLVRKAIQSAEPQRGDVTPEFLASSVPDVEFREILRKIGVKSTILAPLLLRGRVIGVLRLAMAESGRRYSDDDMSLAREIAHHATLAIEAGRLYRTAQQAIEARDNLLEIVSHDLRNYLSTIRMGAGLLAKAEPEEMLRIRVKQLEAIKRSVVRMDQLIESLLDSTMIETGQFRIQTKVEYVADLLDEAWKTMEPQANARAVALRVELDASAGAALCDRERVLQVLANLVGNALKFTQKGGEIRLSAKATPGDTSSVTLSVSDTGCGIAEDELPHVFERRWSGQPSRGGSGLGLFIANGIVKAHGGMMSVQSSPGAGSTFSFILPTAAPDHDRPPQARGAVTEPQGGGPSPVPG